MDISLDFNYTSQSGENSAGLTDDNAFNQFLSDMKDDSPMNVRERFHLIELLRPHGRRLNRLIETLG